MKRRVLCYGEIVTGGFGFDGSAGGRIIGSIGFTPPSSSTKWGIGVFELNVYEFDQKLCSLGRFVELVHRKVGELLREYKPHLLISYARDDAEADVLLALPMNEGRRRPVSVEGWYINGIYFPRRTCNAMWDTSGYDKLRVAHPRAEIVPKKDKGKRFFWKSFDEDGETIIKEKTDHYLPPTKEFLS